MKLKECNLKRNDAGEFLYWAYTYKNTHTGRYYCGVTVNPSGRKSIWKNLEYKYAGEKVYQARKQYHDWANDWVYTETVFTASTFETLLTEMEYTEAYYISIYDSYRNGYNTRPSGSGRGSRSRILVIEKDKKQVVYNSCEDAAEAYTMSPGNVYHYAYGTTTHTRKNKMVFIPIDDATITSSLTPEFLTTYSITLP